MGSLHSKLSRQIGTAIADYGMIEAGDVVAVAVSGGKDSLTLLDILLGMRRRSPVKFDLVAVTVDQGYEGFRWPVMEKHFEGLGVPYHIENTSISEVIEDHKTPGSTWCALCARLRRGVLYRLAKEKGWTKIALGHHADDLIETHMLSQLFNGAVQSMPPILRSQDGQNVVIRPMCYVWERQVVAYTKERKFPVICCACPACRDFSLKRQRIKALLGELEESWPGVKQSLLSAQRRLKLTQLMDPRFLPLGQGAHLAAEAQASPYWGIAQRGGEPQEEPGDGFEPTLPADSGGSSGESAPALLNIRRASARAGVPLAREASNGDFIPESVPAMTNDLCPDRGQPSMAPIHPGTSRPAVAVRRSPAHDGSLVAGPSRTIHPPPQESSENPSPHSERGSCGAICGCGPLA